MPIARHVHDTWEALNLDPRQPHCSYQFTDRPFDRAHCSLAVIDFSVCSNSSSNGDGDRNSSCYYGVSTNSNSSSSSSSSSSGCFPSSDSCSPRRQSSTPTKHRRLSWLGTKSNFLLLALVFGSKFGLTSAQGQDLRAISHDRNSPWELALERGSVWGFPSYSEANGMLDEWLDKYPAVFTKKKAGESYLGKTIWSYVLGVQPSTEAPPRVASQVLLTSLTHAREPAGLTTLLFFIGKLLEAYSESETEASYILRTRTIVLVPFVNPDGYIANEKSLMKMIRKNRRPTCPNDPEDGGVDINRNFASHWAPVEQPCGEENAGSHPFSEPEAQALRGLVEEYNFSMAMNFHSYGRMLTHPYNWADHKSLPKRDDEIYDEVSLAFKFPLFGSASETVGYTTSGEMDDWMYSNKGIISMSPEIGPESGEFWPPSEEISGISKRNFDRILYVVHKAGSQLTSVVPTSRSLQQTALPAKLQKIQGEGGVLLKLANEGLKRSLGSQLGFTLSLPAAASSKVSKFELYTPQGHLIASFDPATTTAAAATAATLDDRAIAATAIPSLPARSTIYVWVRGLNQSDFPTRSMMSCLVEDSLSLDDNGQKSKENQEEEEEEEEVSSANDAWHSPCSCSNLDLEQPPLLPKSVVAESFLTKTTTANEEAAATADEQQSSNNNNINNNDNNNNDKKKSSSSSERGSTARPMWTTPSDIKVGGGLVSLSQTLCANAIKAARQATPQTVEEYSLSDGQMSTVAKDLNKPNQAMLALALVLCLSFLALPLVLARQNPQAAFDCSPLCSRDVKFSNDRFGIGTTPVPVFHMHEFDEGL